MSPVNNSCNMEFVLPQLDCFSPLLSKGTYNTDEAMQTDTGEPYIKFKILYQRSSIYRCKNS